MPEGLTDVQRWQAAIMSEDGPHSTVRHLLLTISVRMSPEGDRSWPGYRELERRTGLSQRTITDRLEEADQEGWVRRLGHRGGKRGRYRQYLPAIPGEVLKDVQHLEARLIREGAEPLSAPWTEEGAEGASAPTPEGAEDPSARGAEDLSGGAEGNSSKVLKELQRSSSRSSSESSEEDGRPPEGAEDLSAPSSPLDNLLEFVGSELAETLEAVASMPGVANPQSWSRALLATYGPGESIDPEIQRVPEEDRPRALGLALSRFISDSTRWRSASFRSFFLTAARNLSEPTATPPEFGDETQRDRKRASEASRRHGTWSAGEQVAAERASAKEIRALGEWYENADTETKDEVADVLARRLDAVGFGGRKKVPDGVRRAFEIAAMREVFGAIESASHCS